MDNGCTDGMTAHAHLISMRHSHIMSWLFKSDRQACGPRPDSRGMTDIGSSAFSAPEIGMRCGETQAEDMVSRAVRHLKRMVTYIYGHM